jgi:hypothetical protein
MPTKTLMTSTLGVVRAEANWMRRCIFAAKLSSRLARASVCDLIDEPIGAQFLFAYDLDASLPNRHRALLQAGHTPPRKYT